MSASIYWRPVTRENHIDVGAPSRFVEVMNRAFGTYPWRLGPSQLERLYGLAAACDDGAKRNPYQALIDAMLLDDGSTREIEVWPEY